MIMISNCGRYNHAYFVFGTKDIQQNVKLINIATIEEKIVGCDICYASRI